MLKIENVEIHGWNAAIRGMRNAMNSWDQSDSYWTHIENPETENTAPFAFFLGEKDLHLASTLVSAGDDHGKWMRYVDVDLDIVAPLYWWKEFDTYKVGTIANSCSTMHKIHAKEFTVDDFSCEHLSHDKNAGVGVLLTIIEALNLNREIFVRSKGNDKSFWWNMIQLLPSSYNQRRTIRLNYSVLRRMYFARRTHKLDEWHTFCDWIETLPYAEELIICE